MSACRICPFPAECAFVACDCECHVGPRLCGELAAAKARVAELEVEVKRLTKEVETLRAQTIARSVH